MGVVDIISTMYRGEAYGMDGVRDNGAKSGGGVILAGGTGGELETTGVNDVHAQRGTAKGIEVKGFWSDAGKFETLLRSADFVASRSDKR